MEPNTQSTSTYQQQSQQRSLSLIIPRRHHLLEYIPITLPHSIKSLNSLIPLQSSQINHYPLKTTKTNTLKQISNQIDFIPNKTEKDKSSLGGLYTLFSSSIFDVNLLIYYLDTKEENPIIDTLVHLMNTKFRNDLYRYIPQLLSIVISKKTNHSLQSFLLATCKMSIGFTLKVNWLSNSFYSKVLIKANRKVLKQLTTMLKAIKIDDRRKAVNTNNSNTFDYKDYYERINEFYDSIASIESNKGKTNEECLIEVKAKLKECNRLIGKMQRILEMNSNAVISQDLKNLYRGFILPIDEKSNTIDDQEQYIITNIAEENISICFNRNSPIGNANTSSNAGLKSMSYLIPFECIIVKEGSMWKDKIAAQVQDINAIEDSNNKDNNKQIEPISIFNPFDQGKKVKETIDSIKHNSQYRNFPSHCIRHFILKTKVDYTNEMIIMQMIYLFSKYFIEADIPLRLTPFQIEVLSESIVLIEQIPNSISLTELKRRLENKMNLNTFFRTFFCNNFEEAQKNLVESLAAYSLVAYLINSQEKLCDNLLLDNTGKVVMMRYGNCFAPYSTNYSMFQIPKDVLEIIDGIGSGMFHYFKSLILKGFIEIKKHVDVLVKIIECELKCLRISGFSDKDKKSVIAALIERFHLTYSDVDLVFKVEEMIK